MFGAPCRGDDIKPRPAAASFVEYVTRSGRTWLFIQAVAAAAVAHGDMALAAFFTATRSADICQLLVQKFSLVKEEEVFPEGHAQPLARRQRLLALNEAATLFALMETRSTLRFIDRKTAPVRLFRAPLRTFCVLILT